MEIKNLTKEEIINLGSDKELAAYLGLRCVETTIGTNGYPLDCSTAIIAENMEDLISLRDKVDSLGFTVYELDLFSRNGWHFWNRSSANYLELGYYKRYVSDQDYYIDIDFDALGEDEIKENLFQLIYCDFSNFDNYSDLISAKDRIEEIYTEIEGLTGNQRIFFDANNSWYVDYIISDETTHYSYDNKHYMVGLHIDFE